MSAPVTGEDVAMLQQAYIKLLLQCDEMFNNITVLAEDDGDIESQMNIALGIITPKSGAYGACVIVRQPIGVDEMPGVQFPPLDNEWDILCLEHRGLNKDTTKGGTGKRAWHLARRAHRILKAHRAPGVLHGITMRRPAIIRSSFIKEVMNGLAVPLVGYTVRAACAEADATSYQQVALPALSGAPALTAGAILTGSVGTVITATCATVGASIYYTTDLTNPCSENSAAILYATPVTTAAGTYMFRAIAPGYIGSNAVTVRIS